MEGFRGFKREKYIKIYGQILEPKEITLTLMKKTNNRLEIDSKKWNRKLDIEEVLIIEGDKQTSRLLLTISRPTDAYPGGSLAIMLEPTELLDVSNFIREMLKQNIDEVVEHKIADTIEKIRTDYAALQARYNGLVGDYKTALQELMAQEKTIDEQKQKLIELQNQPSAQTVIDEIERQLAIAQNLRQTAYEARSYGCLHDYHARVEAYERLLREVKK